MKNLRISFVAIVVAVAAFAFTAPKNAMRAGCSDSTLKWFVLPAGSNVAAATPASAYLSAPKVADLLNDNNANGDFATSAIKTVGNQTTAYTQTGCDATPAYVCAIGFLNSQLIRQQIPGTSNFEWVAPSTTPECIIVRTNP